MSIFKNRKYNVIENGNMLERQKRFSKKLSLPMDVPSKKFMLAVRNM